MPRTPRQEQPSVQPTGEPYGPKRERSNRPLSKEARNLLNAYKDLAISIADREQRGGAPSPEAQVHLQADKELLAAYDLGMTEREIREHPDARATLDYIESRASLRRSLEDAIPFEPPRNATTDQPGTPPITDDTEQASAAQSAQGSEPAADEIPPAPAQEETGAEPPPAPPAAPKQPEGPTTEPTATPLTPEAPPQTEPTEAAPPTTDQPGEPFHPSFEEENLIAEATWDLAKRKGIYRGEAHELLLKTLGKPEAPLTHEALNRIVDELAPPVRKPDEIAEPTQTQKQTPEAQTGERQPTPEPTATAELTPAPPPTSEPQPQLTPEQERRLFEEAERLAKAAGLEGEAGVRKAYQHILRFFSDTAFNRVINENLADRTPRPVAEPTPPAGEEAESKEIQRMMTHDPNLTAERAAELLAKYPDFLPGVGPTRAERIAAAGGEVPPSVLPPRVRPARPAAPAPPPAARASVGAPATPPRPSGMNRAEQEAAFEEFAQREARAAQQAQELRRTPAAPASPEQIQSWDEDDARILKRYAELELTLADATRKGVRPSPEEQRDLAFYRQLVDEANLREYTEAKPILADLEARLAALPPQPPETVPVLDESTLAERPATDGVKVEYPVTAPGPVGVPVLDESVIAEHPPTDGLEAEYSIAPPKPPELQPTPEAAQTQELWETDQRLNGSRRRMERIRAWFSDAASRVWPFGRRAEAPPEPPSEPPSEAEVRAMEVAAFRTAESEKQPEGRARSRISKDLAWHAGRVAANSLGSIFGVKFAWDAFAYLKERGALNREREQVQLALIEMSRALREVRKEKIIGQEQTRTRHAAAQALWEFRKRIKEDAAYLSAAERIEFRKGLRRIEGISRGLNADFTVSELDRVGKLTRLYLVGKTSGYQVVKQGLNSLLFWGSLAVPGAMALRGVVYPGMAALERASKAGRRHEQQRFFDYDSHSRPFWTKQLEQFGAQAKDLFVTSARETHDDLRGKRGALGRVGAVGTLATALGIGGMTIRSFADHTPSETVTQLLDAFERSKAAVKPASERFLKEAADLADRLGLPRPEVSFPGDESLHVPSVEAGHPPGLSEEEIETIEAAQRPPTLPNEHPGWSEQELEQTAQQKLGVEPAETGLGEDEIQRLREAAGALRLDETQPEKLAELLAKTPTATIEQGGNVWQAAKSLVAEGKVSGEDFAKAWEHSVKDLPDLVHRGDMVKFVPGVGDEPPRFEVVPESGLPIGTARNLADVYESLGKEVPSWLQQKIEAAPSLDQRISLIPNTAPEEFREALGEVTAVFSAKDLATQEQTLGNLQELREHLGYQWRAAQGDEARLAEITEDLHKLDATRQQLAGSIEFLKQSRAFEELLRSVEVPAEQRPLLEKLTVSDLLERKDTNALRGLKPLAELVERYTKLTPWYEHPREQVVATFLKKFIVGGKTIEPPTTV